MCTSDASNRMMAEILAARARQQERDEIKAEVAATMNRLVNFNLEMTRELSEAKAEIARLREALAWADNDDPVLVDAIRDRAALKPDPVTINVKVGYMSPEYQAALKPDTGELPPCMAPDGGECCPQYHEAKAEIERLTKALGIAFPYVVAGHNECETDDTEADYLAVRAALKPDTGE